MSPEPPDWCTSIYGGIVLDGFFGWTLSLFSTLMTDYEHFLHCDTCFNWLPWSIKGKFWFWCNILAALAEEKSQQFGHSCTLDLLWTRSATTTELSKDNLCNFSVCVWLCECWWVSARYFYRLVLKPCKCSASVHVLCFVHVMRDGPFSPPKSSATL